MCSRRGAHPSGAISGVGPSVGELGEEARELGALVGGEAPKRLREVLAALTAEPPRDASAVVGQCDSRAARIVGISLTAYEPEVDGLLHEPRGARLINTDRLAELAHR
jgi:hypothetical protein